MKGTTMLTYSCQPFFLSAVKAESRYFSAIKQLQSWKGWMCHLAWRWNKALKGCIRLLSFSSLVLLSKVRGRLSFWEHKVVLHYEPSSFFLPLL